MKKVPCEEKDTDLEEGGWLEEGGEIHGFGCEPAGVNIMTTMTKNSNGDFF